MLDHTLLYCLINRDTHAGDALPYNCKHSIIIHVTLCVISKDKVVLCLISYRDVNAYGRVGSQPHALLTSAIDGVER